MTAPADPTARRERLLAQYRTMRRIRSFEERVLKLFRQGELRGTTHVCIGQEAVAVGGCAALREGDYLSSNHRGHGHLLARGASMRRMMAELFGVREGYARGLGGSQHMAVGEARILGSNGITAGGLPVAAGAGLAARLGAEKAVVLAFLGDGASAQGAFHEAVNLAAVWNLPVVFLVENNQYAMGTRVEETCPGGNLARRADGYGIPGGRVDGNDPAAVEAMVRQSCRRARGGLGPSLVEAITYRQLGHSRSDACEYVPDGEADAWAARDPLTRAAAQLGALGVPAGELQRLADEAEAEVDDAVAHARGGDPLAPQEYLQDAALPAAPARPLARPAPAQAAEHECSYGDALYLAMATALETDPAVTLIGEDIAEYGGAFKITRDLWERFGKERVRNAPISENALVGCGVGAAMAGLRPVVEIMFMDFLLLALDQLGNHAAKFPTLYHGQFRVPLTVRTPAGGRRGYGATHSQCLESLLLGFPGLRIYTPATVQDAHDLLLAAIRDDHPTVVVEHKLLYAARGSLRRAATAEAPGRARILRAGTDLTILTYSHMTTLALAAAEALAEEDISAEVVDLRTLAPLDMETITESCSRTMRALVAEEGHRTGGVGAELSARIQEACFGYLDAPVLRVAAADAIIPTRQELEEAVLPQVTDILAAARRLLAP